MDLISIIVPIYNAEKVIKRCIESISRQSYEMLEIILVDDGSTDQSLERYVTLVWQRQLRRPERQTAYRNICADTQKQRSDI